MGSAVVVSRDGRSRYTILEDYGTAKQAARLAVLSAELIKATSAVDEAQAADTLATNAETLQKANVAQAFVDYAAAAAALQPGQPLPSSAGYLAQLKALYALQTKNSPVHMKLASAKVAKANLLKQIAYVTSVQTTRTRQAWRPVFEFDVEAIAPGATVTTIEINGEADLVMVRHAGNVVAASGTVEARELCTPEQAYFNVAILPGWQKFKPTFRWGVCLGVDFEAATMSVELAPATSSAQKLNINRESTLVNVPIDLVSPGISDVARNAWCFDVGDRVVVEFLAQDFAQPRVIGHLDNPVKGRCQCSFTWKLFFFTTTSAEHAATQPEGAIFDGHVSRHFTTVSVTAPNLAALGVFLVGWGDKDVTLNRTDTWANDNRSLYGGSYSALDMRNNGLGEAVSLPARFYPFASIFQGYTPIYSGPLESGWAAVIDSDPFVKTSNTLGYVATWTFEPWQYPEAGATTSKTYFTCSSAVAADACVLVETGKTAAKAKLVWEDSVGNLLSVQTVLVDKWGFAGSLLETDGTGLWAVTKHAASVWG